jgi:hypothetical protein
VFVGGRVLPAGGSTGDAGRLAADVKRDCNADVALAAGRRRPGPDGREIVDIVLDGPAGTTQVEHVLGGGPAVAGPRAAKTAVDLVRRTLAVRDPKGAAAP